jgi:Major Facilitator Superfamily
MSTRQVAAYGSSLVFPEPAIFHLVKAIRLRLRTSLDALRMAFANADLRRLQLAQAGSLMGTWAYAVALAVYAYGVDGATGVAIVTLFRLVPAAIAAPFTSALGDRLGRVRVMLATDFIRASVMGVMAVGIWLDAPPLLIYAFSGISAASNTAFRPAQRALLPGLARTPDELTATNVASSTIESVGLFAGPALGGLLLAVTSIPVVLAVNGLSFLWSAWMILRLDSRRAEREAPARAPTARRSFWRDAGQGFVVVARDSGARAVVLLTGA